ncbi:pseudouridine synthase [Candidatus Amarolinea aalborgensis]|uniref:pseudouridine synthase n=1 Tax=Candidatus Amarolinea aalborgensis TaxID=2249329 RepID=UPI003BFA20A0
MVRFTQTAPEVRRGARYFLLNKPYGVLCQFTDAAARPTLAGLFPVTDMYAAGRLDADSEGLLLLTNDGGLIHRLAQPSFKQPKTYLAQVERIPDEAALARLRQGVVIEGQTTLPAQVELLSAPPALWERSAPIRFRQSVPTAWLRLVLTEGRNRQVRKMTAAVGFPTLRLVRISIGPFTIGDLQPGQWQEVPASLVRRLLNNSRPQQGSG